MDEPAENPAKEQRRKEILDAAFAEFTAKGYAGASMAAIARRAQASKETLYAWFENKETLFNTLFASRLDAMVTRVSAVATEETPSPDVLLPVVAEDVLRFMLAMAPLNQAMGVSEPSEMAKRLVTQTIRQERARFVDYLLRCRDRGYVAFDDDPFELVSLFVAMAEGEWSLRLGAGMIDEITDRMIKDHAQRVTRLFLKGLAPAR
jgi:AcrR family transcriptional regulator